MNEYVMMATRLLNQIFEAAAQKGLDRPRVIKAAGLHESAVSRIYRVGDCRLSTLEKLAGAAGLRLVVVQDNESAELLLKGELF